MDDKQWDGGKSRCRYSQPKEKSPTSDPSKLASNAESREVNIRCSCERRFNSFRLKRARFVVASATPPITIGDDGRKFDLATQLSWDLAKIPTLRCA